MIRYVLAVMLLAGGASALPDRDNPHHEKVEICHNDHHEIEVDQHAVDAHLAHGDCLGECPCAAPPECQTDIDCDNGFFCDGSEVCELGECVAGQPPCADASLCDEHTDVCSSPPECVSDEDCDDGLFCNGVETCLGGTCSSSSEEVCLGEVCLEEENVCTAPPECTCDNDCSNGLFCDGHELCDDGLCVTSVLPCPENESCDEEFDACFGGEGEGEGEVSEGEGEPDRAGASDEALFVSGSGLFSCSNSPSSGIGFLALLFPILLVFGKRSKTIAMSVMLMAATAVNAEGLNRITGPVSSVDTPQAASADTLPELTLQTSAGLDYSHAPVVLRDSDFAKRVNLVEHQFSGRINAAFGLADFVQLDLSLPASLAFGPGFDLGDVPAVGLQDMMGGVRVRLTERDSPVRAAFSLRGSLPTSLVSSNGFPLLGESLPTVSPGVLLSTGGEAASVMLDTSYTLRAPKAVADLQIGHTVNASLGGQVRLIDDHLWAIADVGGSFSVNHLFSNRLFLPLEATVGLRGRNGPIFGTASVGSGLMPDVGTPDVRALATVGFDFDFAPKKVTPAVTPVAEPAPPPPAPLDSDGDGILDGSDACPEDPEDFDGFEDADGCPETEKVVVGPDSIVILEPIYFFFDSDRIRPESFDVLEDVVTALKEHPEIRLLSVEGHTSSEGSTSYNQRLSAKRAAAVVAFLAKAGVAAERLSSLGHGESKPVAPNTTRAGRERNRRVEFLILEKQ